MKKRKDIKIAESKLLHRNVPIVSKSKVIETAKETDHIYIIVFQCSATAATLISKGFDFKGLACSPNNSLVVGTGSFRPLLEEVNS